jgi:arsenite/tail-anchored protein-transporting ATPase
LDLPLANRADVTADRVGDDLVVRVGAHRRVLTLPHRLRYCTVVGGRLENGRLEVRFREQDPDAASGPTEPPTQITDSTDPAGGSEQ